MYDMITLYLFGAIVHIPIVYLSKVDVASTWKI